MRFILVTALFLSTSSAVASSTMCAFYAPPGAPVPDLEFLGYDKIGGILIQEKNGPRSLPQGSYKVVALDQSASRIDLTYANPGDHSLPPSFRLRGAGPDMTLTVRGKTYKGKLSCGAWLAICDPLVVNQRCAAELKAGTGASTEPGTCWRPVCTGRLFGEAVVKSMDWSHVVPPYRLEFIQPNDNSRGSTQKRQLAT